MAAPDPHSGGTVESATAHQFNDLEQQHEADNLGMFIFLATEVMFFGGLFTSYCIFRGKYFDAFSVGSHLLFVKFGAINTAVLICSSLTMAMAVYSAHLGRRKSLISFLILTMILGAAFVAIKLKFEWFHDWEVGLVPGIHWAPQEEVQNILRAGAGHVQLFMCFYFFMTGVHALHMVVGLGILTVLLIQAYRGHMLGERHFASVEVSGLYWHFVDIIWIFLFPLLYLIGGRYAGS